MDSQHLQPPPNVLNATQQFISDRDDLAAAFRAGKSSLRTSSDLTRLTDQWLIVLWQHAVVPEVRKHCSLYALGGYGRCDLAFYSDIDLLIEVVSDDIYDSLELRNGVERFMTWCRDTRLKLAHAVRTKAHAAQAFRDDIRSAVALIDARPINAAESNAIVLDASHINAALQFLRDDNQGVTFIQFLIENRRQRLKNHGQTVYLLEPDLKVSEGSLRDLHAIYWAARVRFGFHPLKDLCTDANWTERDREAYGEAMNLFLKLRHYLHLHHKRKHDRLSFPDQEFLAQTLAKCGADLWGPELFGAELRDADTARRQVEILMRRYYQVARQISLMTERFLRHWKHSDAAIAIPITNRFERFHDQLALRKDVENPEITAFECLHSLKLASAHDLMLDPILEQEIVQNISQWPPDIQHNTEITSQLVELLCALDISPQTSHSLLELQILPHLVPEFEPIICHVQHDTYHVYTTDRHSLKCLELTRRLLLGNMDDSQDKWPMFFTIAAEIQHQATLLLASLFHDIGKNRGGNHSQIGAALVTNIGLRWNLNPEMIEQIAFLVREHLTLSHAARQRDISDPRVIRDIAARLKTVETLNQLTVLTFCDMSTVAPNIMTDWNANLLIKLYQRLRAALELGVESLWKTSQEQVQAQIHLLVQLWRQSLPSQEAPITGVMRNRLDEFIRDIPTDHLLTTTPEALLRQFTVYDRSRTDNAIAISSIPLIERGVTEIIVTTRDVHGTLAKICGVFSASNLNILSASIVTTTSGRTLDIFMVNQSNSATTLLNNSESIPLTDARRIERLENQLTQVLTDAHNVEDLLTQRMNQHRLAPRPTPQVKTSIAIHQDISDSFTVIEVKAPDQLGLLYQITRTVWEHDISTHFSKVDSLGNQVIDIFYVEDINGGKLSDEKIDALSQSLYAAIEESPFTR